MEQASCAQEVRDAFLPQEQAVLALATRDGGTLWRADVLTALDGICEGVEDEQTDYEIAVKCITSISLMEARKGVPPRMVVLRDEMPLDPDADLMRLKELGTSLEFSLRDTIDATGTRAYVHMPLASFDGVDIPSLVSSLLGEQEVLDGALHMPGTEVPEGYQEVAADGPTAHAIVGLYDAGVDGGLKDPVHLAVLERVQQRAETLRNVAQSFTIVDDLKVTRQGLKGGRDEMFALPTSKAETAQLLLALSMSPATRLGPRLDGRERVGLMRVNLGVTTADQRRRIARKLDGFLAQETPEGARAFFCRDEATETVEATNGD